MIKKGGLRGLKDYTQRLYESGLPQHMGTVIRLTAELIQLRENDECKNSVKTSSVSTHPLMLIDT